jgi:hypothetical protein
MAEDDGLILAPVLVVEIDSIDGLFPIFKLGDVPP